MRGLDRPNRGRISPGQPKREFGVIGPPPWPTFSFSYCSADRSVAGKVVEALAAEGISVWWDDRLTPIEQWDRLIEKEIHIASAVLVIWTPRAIESDWVRIEANFGRQRKKLLQARLEECDVPLQFTSLQWLDLDSWLASGDTKHWQKLVPWFRALYRSARARRSAGAITESVRTH